MDAELLPAADRDGRGLVLTISAECPGKDASASRMDFERTLLESSADLQTHEQELQAELQELVDLFQTRSKPIRDKLDEVRKQLAEKAVQLDQLQSSLSGEGVPPGPEWLRWVAKDMFHIVCMMVIIANSVLMFLELRSKNVADEYWWMDQLFLAWYFMELALKVVLYQRSFLCGPASVDRCFAWLDLVIVTSGALDQWIMPALSSRGKDKPDLIPFDAPGLRALRLLRVTRVLRLVKVLNLLTQMDLSWADGPRFESFITGIIVMNAVTMGLELDIPWEGFHWLNLGMLLVYMFEILVRMKHHKWKFFNHETHGLWNSLDFVIVAGGAVEQLAVPTYETVVTLATGQARGDSHQGLLSLLRIFRLTRIARLYRLFTMFKALRQLVFGIAEAMQATIWVIMLTFIVLYVFAILFSELVGHGIVFAGNTPPEAAAAFGTVEGSLYVLFKLMNNDQSVVDFTNSLWVKVMFMVSIVVLNWVMLATLTSVVTAHMESSTLHQTQQDDKRDTEVNKLLCVARLKYIFKELDKDGNGFVEREEFEALLKNAGLRQVLLECSGLTEPRDLMELFEYTSHPMGDGQRAILFEDFIHKVQTEGKPASERSIFRLEEELRASELRNERRFQNLIQLLRAPEGVRADMQPKRLEVLRPRPTLPRWVSMTFDDVRRTPSAAPSVEGGARVQT